MAHELTARPHQPPAVENTMTDRPFADEPTEVLRHALDLANVHARQAARFNPDQPDTALPAVVDLLTAELQHREGTAAPTDEDFLVAIEEALEKNLLPTPGVTVLERTRDAVLGAVGPLVDRLRAAAPAGPAPDTDRAALSAKLWQIAEHHIVAEWICCEPLNPKHDLCAKGYAALGMVKTLLVDGDPEKAWNPQAPLLDLVLSLLPAPTDQTAVARVRALHQPMERGPFTICAHCSGWDGKWRCLGVVTDYPCPTVRALDGEPAREAQQDPTQDGETP